MTASESSTTQHVPKCPKMKTPKLSASKLIVTAATIAERLPPTPTSKNCITTTNCAPPHPLRKLESRLERNTKRSMMGGQTASRQAAPVPAPTPPVEHCKNSAAAASLRRTTPTAEAEDRNNKSASAELWATPNVAIATDQKRNNVRNKPLHAPNGTEQQRVQRASNAADDDEIADSSSSSDDNSSGENLNGRNFNSMVAEDCVECLPYLGRLVDNSDEWMRYLRVNRNASQKYTDYQSYSIIWRKPDDYRLLMHIGRGKYSEVFMCKKRALITATNVQASEELRVVKILKPIRYVKLLREVKILNDLSGHRNIVKLLDVVRNEETNIYSYIFEYVETDNPRKLYPQFNLFDIQHYLYQILLGVDFIHSRGIMHRDLKPINILYNIKTRDLKIIDFGLAEYYIEDKEYVVRVATKHFKGPEILLEHAKYDYALDMWALGCILASIIFMKDPFFQGDDNKDMILKIVNVLGYDELMKCVNKYQYKFSDPAYLKSMEGIKAKPWSDFHHTRYIERISANSLNLLESLLVIDHRCRISSRQAMQHPYFESVRLVYGDNTST